MVVQVLTRIVLVILVLFLCACCREGLSHTPLNDWVVFTCGSALASFEAPRGTHVKHRDTSSLIQIHPIQPPFGTLADNQYLFVATILPTSRTEQEERVESSLEFTFELQHWRGPRGDCSSNVNSSLLRPGSHIRASGRSPNPPRAGRDRRNPPSRTPPASPQTILPGSLRSRDCRASRAFRNISSRSYHASSSE